MNRFGPIKICVILRPKEQVMFKGFCYVKALVEMERLEDAVSLHEYYLTNHCVIRNHPVEVNYSIHQHLQRNPLDYTPSHIILVTMCGCAKSPLSIFEMASVLSMCVCYE